MQAVADKKVHISRDGELELFGYNAVMSYHMWDKYCLLARGLVLNHSERRVVATPFPKFFNYGEGGVKLPALPFEVTEKMDGSLGILFHHGTSWRVTTRGSLTSEQGLWATRYLQHLPWGPGPRHHLPRGDRLSGQPHRHSV